MHDAHVRTNPTLASHGFSSWYACLSEFFLSFTPPRSAKVLRTNSHVGPFLFAQNSGHVGTCSGPYISQQNIQMFSVPTVGRMHTMYTLTLVHKHCSLSFLLQLVHRHRSVVQYTVDSPRTHIWIETGLGQGHLTSECGRKK